MVVEEGVQYEVFVCGDANNERTSPSQLVTHHHRKFKVVSRFDHLLCMLFTLGLPPPPPPSPQNPSLPHRSACLPQSPLQFIGELLLHHTHKKQHLDRITKPQRKELKHSIFPFSLLTNPRVQNAQKHPIIAPQKSNPFFCV